MISENIINRRKERLAPQEKTKKNLQESEEKYRKLIEIANDAIFLADVETGIILEANKQAEELLGVPVEEIVGMHYTQIYPPEDVERNKELFKKYSQSDKSITLEDIFVQHKDGRKISVEISSSAFKLGDKNVILGIFRDITNRKRIEKELITLDESLEQRVVERTAELSKLNKELKIKIIERKKAEEGIRGLARFPSENPNPVIRVSNDGNILYYNKASTFLLDFWGCQTTKMLPDNYIKIVSNVLRSGLSSVAETECKDRVISLTFAPIIEEGYVNIYGMDITKRKKAEEEIKSLARFPSETPNPLLRVERNGAVIFTNIAGTLFLDYWGTQTGQSVPEDWHKHVLSVLRSRKSRNYEMKCNDRIFSIILAPVVEEGYVNFFGFDITRRRKADVQIRKLSSAVENSPSTVVITDNKGNIEYVNPRFTQITGYAFEEAIGKNPRILRSGKTPPEVYKKLWETITSGSEWRGEFCNRKKNGELYWEAASISSIKNEKGVITNFVAVKEDITERKQMEEELRMLNESLELRISERTGELAKSNEELRSSKKSLTKAQRIARMGSWDWDIVNNKLLWSSEIYRILGFKPQEVDATYDTFLRSVHPDDREAVKKAVNEAICGRAPYNVEHRIVLPDGTERVVHEQAEVILDENDKPIRMIGTVQDITELIKREEEFIKAQKLDSIGVLAGGIAHDFNNYLQRIMSHINLAQAYAGSNEKINEQLVQAQKTISQSKDLSQRLITFSKGGDPIRQTVFISKLIQDSVSLVMSSPRFDCQIGVPDNLWPVEADKGQLNQVFSNIVINAKQAMPNRGKINVSAENIEIKKKALLPLKEGKYVKVTIKDQGTGISLENLQRIFDPYFTTKESGNGLGLATCFSIVKKHGGHISVESELDVGTTFYTYLPVSMKVMKEMPSLGETKKEGAEQTSINGKRKVLLMDDEEVIRLAITQHLRNLKYEVEAASDGTEAIALYKKAIESGKSFDAVVMDLTVPGEMGGKEATKRLLEIDPKANVIVASGYVNDPIMAEFKEYGFKSVLTKPYEIDELDEALQKVIMGKES